MNALNLARSAYAGTATPIRTDRGTEYDVFARITHQMKSAAEHPDRFPALVQALHENRRLWTILAADVSGKDNALSETLRAQIFYLAEFTKHHSRKILAGEGTIDALIDINTAIMRGLRGEEAPS